MEETIYYNSPLGWLRVSAGREAINSIWFVETEKNGQEAAALSFLTSSSSTLLLKCLLQLDDYFAGRHLGFDLPLRQEGTDFQQKVWKALQDIPPGKTCSYAELSKKIGDIKATRAVGTANGKNNIAIVVPCHRVIGSNGNLVGYGGDLWRKQWLLNHEAKYTNGVQTLF